MTISNIFLILRINIKTNNDSFLFSFLHFNTYIMAYYKLPVDSPPF